MVFSRAGEIEEMMSPYERMDYLIGSQIIGKKAKRNRDILREHFLDGYTYEEIAEHFEMSAVQIGRIVRKYGDPLLLMLEK